MKSFNCSIVCMIENDVQLNSAMCYSLYSWLSDSKLNSINYVLTDEEVIVDETGYMSGGHIDNNALDIPRNFKQYEL